MNIGTRHRSLNCSRRPGPHAGVAADPVWVGVALSGDIDVASKRALRILDAAVAENPGARILVDLSNVTFLDSSALNAFIRPDPGRRHRRHGRPARRQPTVANLAPRTRTRRSRSNEPSRMNMNPATPGTRDQPSCDPEPPGVHGPTSSRERAATTYAEATALSRRTRSTSQRRRDSDP